MPKEKYSYAPEIYEHTQRIGEYFGLYDTRSSRPASPRCAGSRTRAAGGCRPPQRRHPQRASSSRRPAPPTGPSCPAFPGIKDFKGHTFHTSRWDYEYTGGDHTGGLTRLADKRVAIIGTGATAIQCVPFLGEHAKQLYVFQRTPSSVDLRGNRRPTSRGTARWARLAARAPRELRRGAGRTERSARTWWPTAGPTSPGASASRS
jgi:cyclohexanone monooxygenase